MIEFDLILNKIGHLGRYQIFVVFMVYWLGIPIGLHNIASVFYAAPVLHRCKAPPIDNITTCPDQSEEVILNLTTPYDPSESKYDTCKRYAYNLTECDEATCTCGGENCECVNKTVGSIPCDMGYYFDTSEFTSTVDTEWGLLCDRKILSAAATSSYFLGMWAGAIVFGYMSDNAGRRPTMFVCGLGTLVFGVATSFAPWFWLFVVARFLVAAFSHGEFLTMCIYVMEITGDKRTLTGIHAHSAGAIGYMLNSVLAYYFRDWRTYYFAISLVHFPYMIFHFWVPESPRWHFSHSRDEIGKIISHKFAKHNGKEITPEDWKKAETGQTHKELTGRKYSSLDLFKPPRMRLITLNSMFSWFVISLVYYGLSLNAGNLAGDIFLNNACNGVVELVGNITVAQTMDRFGRRILLAGAFHLAGLSCIGSMLLFQFAGENAALVTTGVVLAFIGKMGTSAQFAIIFNYTAELYPTVARSNGLGVGSMAARWGCILAPFIILIQDHSPWVPSTIFGLLSLVAGGLALLFPETNNRVMPQTIKEAELFYKGKLMKPEHESLLHLEIAKVERNGSSDDFTEL